MIAMLGLEVFTVTPNSQRRAPLQGNAPWVAEIIGLTREGKFARRFVQGDADYTHANSVGSRGIHRWYHLHSGRIYEVADRHTRRGACFAHSCCRCRNISRHVWPRRR